MRAPDQLTQVMTDGRVPFSEDDLADKFSTEHINDLRYCHDWGRWLEWTGTHWHVDRTVHVFDLVRDVCGQAAAQCNSNGKRLATAATVWHGSWRSMTALGHLETFPALPRMSEAG